MKKLFNLLFGWVFGLDSINLNIEQIPQYDCKKNKHDYKYVVLNICPGEIERIRVCKLCKHVDPSY